jgi:hypothetical protein
MVIKIKALHLAAYIKAHGGILISVDKNSFVFETDKTISEWRIEHASSCCRHVDRELIDLRSMLKNQK